MTVLGTIVPATPLDASDDSRLVFSGSLATETLNRAMGDTPADFGTMDATLSWTVEYGTSAAWVDDTFDILIYIANGATQLAGGSATLGVGDVVFNDIRNTTDTTSAATQFTYVNTTANKTTWDGASVYIISDIAKSKGWDARVLQVDYVALTGDYTAAAADWSVTTNAPDALVVAPQITTIAHDINTTSNVDALVVSGKLADIAISTPVTINTNVDALVVSGKLAGISIAAPTTISANTDAMVISGKLATITNNFDATTNVDALVVSGKLSTISTSTPTEITTNAPQALVISEKLATVDSTVNIAANTDAMVVSGKTADLILDSNIDTNIDALSISTKTATITNDIDITSNVHALVVSGKVMSLSTGLNIAANPDAMVISTKTATITNVFSITTGAPQSLAVSGKLSTIDIGSTSFQAAWAKPTQLIGAM